MRVGFDCRGLRPNYKAHFGRGTGRYVSELLGALKQSSEVEIVSFDYEEPALLDKLPFGKRSVGQQFILPSKVRSLGVDCFHFPSHMDAPVFPGVRTYVTVLDIIPILFEELYSKDKPNLGYKAARFLENSVIRKASGVLAISECTKQDLINYFDIPEERVFVTPLGVSETFINQAKIGTEREPAEIELRGRFDLPEQSKVLLYVGGIDQRKNVNFLFDVIEKLPDVFLIFAGNYRNDHHYGTFASRCASSGRVIDAGFLSDEELRLCYQGANIFVFPSLYEGFGLPVLEAMASGLPVVSANNSAIPEVVGSAGELVSGFDAQDWVEAINSVLNDRSRELELSRKGHLRAQGFTWQRTASKTIEAWSIWRSAGHSDE